MNTRAPLSLVAFLAALSLAAPARGQYPPPPAIAPPPPPLPLPPPMPVQPAPVQPTTAPAPVDESVLRAVIGRPVELQLASGQTVSGQLFSLESGNAAIAAGNGQVVVVRCAEVTSLRLLQGGPIKAGKARREKEELEGDSSDRHFGLQFGAGPGVLAADFHYGSFYGYLSTSIALPMYVAGSNSSSSSGNTPIDGVTLAPGLTFRLAPDRNWWFDLFVHASLSFYYAESYNPYTYGYGSTTVNTDASFGIGVGFHYTSPSGFTAGFKVPVIGFAFGNDVNSVSSSGEYYYLSTLLSFPIATVGYRF